MLLRHSLIHLLQEHLYRLDCSLPIDRLDLSAQRFIAELHGKNLIFEEILITIDSFSFPFEDIQQGTQDVGAGDLYATEGNPSL